MKHPSIHTAAVLALVVVLVSAPAIATTAATTVRSVDSAERIDPTDLSDGDEFERWLDETMVDQLERHHVPGAAVVVVGGGEVALAKGYGYADLESQRPVVANETVFRIGSTGKLVTWTAVMQGAEDGRLELDRDVNDYLTDSAVTIPETSPEPITLTHLGTHSAGFADTVDGMVVDTPAELRPMEETLAEHRPARVRPPGEFVAYSNYGTALAGHVVAEQYDTTFVALAPTTAIRILNIVGVAFVLTWIYNATGSVLLAILAHTGFNTANSTLVPLPLEVVSAGDSTTILVVTTVVLWIVVAVLLVGTRGRLGYDGDSSDVRRAERSRLDTR